MYTTNSSRDENETNVVDTLLALPAKSLRRQIKRIKSSLLQRYTLRDSILTDLFTRTGQLQDRELLLRYAEQVDFRDPRSGETSREKSKLEQLIHEEQLRSFTDIRLLILELERYTRELETELAKLELLQNQNGDNR